MEWIDCHCRCARQTPAPQADFDPTIDHYLGEMARLGIDGALVISAWSETISPDKANQQLFDDLADLPQLAPTPEVLPEGGEAFLGDPGAAIDDLVARGAAAGLALPQKSGFVLTAWCAGEMLEAMQGRRLPLMLYLDQLSADHLHDLLRDFPDLPVLLQNVPRTGYHRVVLPLLERFTNLYACFEPRHSVHGGFDYLVGRFGAERFFWGTNYPISEGGCAVTGLRYTHLSEADIGLIAGGTIKRLQSEVRRG